MVTLPPHKFRCPFRVHPASDRTAYSGLLTQGHVRPFYPVPSLARTDRRQLTLPRRRPGGFALDSGTGNVSPVECTPKGSRRPSSYWRLWLCSAARYARWRVRRNGCCYVRLLPRLASWAPSGSASRFTMRSSLASRRGYTLPGTLLRPLAIYAGVTLSLSVLPVRSKRCFRHPPR